MIIAFVIVIVVVVLIAVVVISGLYFDGDKHTGGNLDILTDEDKKYLVDMENKNGESYIHFCAYPYSEPQQSTDHGKEDRTCSYCTQINNTPLRSQELPCDNSIYEPDNDYDCAYPKIGIKCTPENNFALFYPRLHIAYQWDDEWLEKTGTHGMLYNPDTKLKMIVAKYVISMLTNAVAWAKKQLPDSTIVFGEISGDGKYYDEYSLNRKQNKGTIYPYFHVSNSEEHMYGRTWSHIHMQVPLAKTDDGFSYDDLRKYKNTEKWKNGLQFMATNITGQNPFDLRHVHANGVNPFWILEHLMDGHKTEFQKILKRFRITRNLYRNEPHTDMGTNISKMVTSIRGDAASKIGYNILTPIVKGDTSIVQVHIQESVAKRMKELEDNNNRDGDELAKSLILLGDYGKNVAIAISIFSSNAYSTINALKYICGLLMNVGPYTLSSFGAEILSNTYKNYLGAKLKNTHISKLFQKQTPDITIDDIQCTTEEKNEIRDKGLRDYKDLTDYINANDGCFNLATADTLMYLAFHLYNTKCNNLFLRRIDKAEPYLLPKKVQTFTSTYPIHTSFDKSSTSIDTYILAKSIKILPLNAFSIYKEENEILLERFEVVNSFMLSYSPIIKYKNTKYIDGNRSNTTVFKAIKETKDDLVTDELIEDFKGEGYVLGKSFLSPRIIKKLRNPSYLKFHKRFDKIMTTTLIGGTSNKDVDYFNTLLFLNYSAFYLCGYLNKYPTREGVIASQELQEFTDIAPPQPTLIQEAIYGGSPERGFVAVYCDFLDIIKGKSLDDDLINKVKSTLISL